MNEKLLQYLWNFKILNSFDFKDVTGREIRILDFGKWNFDSGPDFLFAKIEIDGVLLAGHIELHVRSSDWIFHRHAGNPEFCNIILHAVYLHDADIQEFTEANIPTLELLQYIDENVPKKYELLLRESHFIPCEKIFMPAAVPFQFTEELLLKKLSEKAAEIQAALARCKNDYEAVLFQYVAYAFGLKVNAEIFRQLAESLDFSVFRKVRQDFTQLQALFYGLCSWLEHPQDEQMKLWRREFCFLQSKYNLPTWRFIPKFSKLRPPNFPTVRLSQLAALYHRHQNLFSQVISAHSLEEILDIFKDIQADEYWDTRFTFGKTSTVQGAKILSRDFINLILINAVFPIKYAYHLATEENVHDEILELYCGLEAENNTVIAGWRALQLPVENALESQAFIFQYQNFCLPKNCMQCGIGLNLLR